jgi:hypothetical protein
MWQHRVASPQGKQPNVALGLELTVWLRVLGIAGLSGAFLQAAVAAVVLLVALCAAAAWYSRLPPERRRSVRQFIELLVPWSRSP